MTPTEQEIWVLTREVNAYDQYGAYFVTAWIGKPTTEQLSAFMKALDASRYWDIDHLMNGGGRKGDEYDWYNLEKQ